MRFGRKRDQSVPEEAAAPEVPETAAPATGPFDVADIDLEESNLIDLGSLLIAPMENTDLRVQVDDTSGEILSVMLLGENAALEVRAFAAPRQPGLWEDTRRQIAAEIARAGGTADEREGTFGPELFVQQPITTEDGQQGVQPSRVLGHEGPRWFLRSTLFGVPAVDPAEAGRWEDAVRAIVVRRGNDAMPPGEALPLVLPPDATRLD
ncbi:MAG: DUF3710 domain-containing protein [Myxococcales bacterium]|nr:MAG: DUF3710 domain-containing protein [Myxococcales bacterium]